MEPAFTVSQEVSVRVQPGVRQAEPPGPRSVCVCLCVPARVFVYAVCVRLGDQGVSIGQHGSDSALRSIALF